MANTKQSRVNFSEFVASLNVYVRIGEDGDIVDTRSALVTAFLDLIAKNGIEDILNLYEAEDLAAMMSGHLRFDKKAADLVPMTKMVDGQETPIPGAMEILKILGEVLPLKRKILVLLAQASNDRQMSRKLTLIES